MPKYQCHKTVDAEKIVSIEAVEESGLQIATLANGETASLPENPRYTAVPGDYLVTYADGYQSVSPAKAFEEGYSLKAPLPDKLTAEDVEATIQKEEYFKSEMLTICALTLKNGFKVTGTSACANPSIYDEQKGREYARIEAVKEIWPIEGYLLKQRMYERGAA
ncbi:MAG: Gp49 family protein [Cellvibrionaceae bacterium]